MGADVIEPEEDPSRCLHRLHGYELYDEDGKPHVVHHFSRGKNKQCFVEYLDLFHEDDWEGKRAREVRQEFMGTWENYVSWQDANRRPE